MKRSILQKMFIIIVTSVLLISTLLFGWLYIIATNGTKQELKDITLYFAEVIEKEEDGTIFLEKNPKFANIRITYIQNDGEVLYDSQKNAKLMENHLSRVEIEQAQKQGEAYIVRYSETLATQTMYYAYVLNNGNILRASIQSSSIFAHMFYNIPAIIFIIILIFLFAIFLANILTKRIINPINEIDLKNPLMTNVYPEFMPILRRIDQQNLIIYQQIEELKQKELEFSSVINHMQEGLILLNATGEILFINESVYKILEAKEVMPKTTYQQYIRNQSLKKALDDALQSKKTEQNILLKNRWYQMNVSPIILENQIQGIVVLFLDVTEQLETEKRRKEFSGNVSHELKTPLQSISGYAEIISQGLVKADDIPSFSQKIYDESQRLIQLINEIIMLSRLDEEATGQKQEYIVIDIKNMLEIIIDDLMIKANKMNIKIEIIGDSFSVYQTYALLFELLYNIVDNAIKYNQEDGKITMILEKTDNYKMIKVIDSGIGIAPDDLPYIFERFYRGDKSRAKTIDGTGIGLSLVKHIAEIQNIDIEVESLLAVGTTFSIRFDNDIV